MSAEHDRLLALQAVQEATARAEAAEAEVERLTTELAHYKHGLAHEDIERIGRERDQAREALSISKDWGGGKLVAVLRERDEARALLVEAAQHLRALGDRPMALRIRDLLDGAACGELSPERSCACHLPRGHVGAHEGRRGPYQLSSWASGLDGAE